MTRTLTKVRIFVASPGDVADERARLARVVESMNKSGGLAEWLGLTLELLRWDTHVPPDVGRPQGLIFDRLDPRGWDIFVGILWTRFGTETGAARGPDGEHYLSGTEEEFEEALRRRRLGGTGWPKIMFYRCERLPPSLREIDPDQLGRVNNFFKQFEPDGRHPGLVRPYREPADFERIVREDLEARLHEYAHDFLGGRRGVGDGDGADALPAAAHATADGLEVTAPEGVFRYFLDRNFTWLHTWLTLRIGRPKRPPEWHVLHNYLSTLRSDIAADITEKTYVEPHAKAPPDDVDRVEPQRTGFLTPIQQVIKEIVGVSQGGDAQSAQLSAISKKSKFVGDLVERLMEADEPLLLLGDPGTGKSITLQQAAMLIAGRESRRIFPNVCLFVRLGEFRPDGEATADSVWAYVKRSTPPEVRPYLDSLDAQGRLIIFFDGMDEMSRERYNDYTKALSVFAESRKERGTRTLFSCRITDFTPRFQHRRLVLLPFGRGQIYRYLTRQLRFPITVGGRSWKAWPLAKRLAAGGLPMQADNPFVLWLLCTYLRYRKDWPESRVQLLAYYNRHNYERKAQDAARRGHPLPDMEQALGTWGRVAYEITNRNKGAAIPLRDVEALVGPVGMPDVQAGMQCGVLQKSLDTEETLVRFEHHRFQEYFTADYLNRHPAERAALNWLDKLDAPRWQETLFNLVLMGGGGEALAALREAIARGHAHLAAGRAEGSPAVRDARAETLLADRVELASRVLQQARQRGGEALSGLSETFRDAVYWLADNGNPITQVKMLLASKVVPDVDVFRVARESLASGVAWVRQQALIVTSVAARDVGEGALQEDLLHSFASGRFAARAAGYLRIAYALRQKRLWAVLALGIALTLAQLFAGYWAAVTASAAMPRAADTLASARETFADWAHDRQEAEAREQGDTKKLEEVKKLRESVAGEQVRFTEVTSGARGLLGTRWFFALLTGVYFLTFFYATRRLQGQQLLTALGAATALPLVAYIWWALWLSHWGVLFQLLLVSVFIGVPLLILTGWTVTLISQASSLLLFAAAASQRKGLPRRVGTLLQAMWVNCGFRTWVKTTGGYVAVTLGFSSMFFVMFTIDYNQEAVKAFIRAHGLFPFLPPAGNAAASVVTFVEGILIPAALVSWLRGRLRGVSVDLFWFLLPGMVFLLIAALAFLFWGLSLIAWAEIWQFLLRVAGLFPSLPPVANAILSAVVYAVMFGAARALWTGTRRGWKPALKPFAKLGAICLGVSVGLYLFGRAALVDWKAILKAVASTLGLFRSLPNPLNAAFSIAVYAEAVGLAVAAFAALRREPGGARRGRELLVTWTYVCLGFVAVVVLLWGSYLYSNYLALALAYVVGIMVAVSLCIIAGRLAREMAPYIVVWRGPIAGHRYTTESWKAELRALDPDYQAALLRRTKPDAFGLPVGEFLALLESVEGVIKEDPAQSAYWAKRQQIEQIIRQERVG